MCQKTVMSTYGCTPVAESSIFYIWLLTRQRKMNVKCFLLQKKMFSADCVNNHVISLPLAVHIIHRHWYGREIFFDFMYTWNYVQCTRSDSDCVLSYIGFYLLFFSLTCWRDFLLLRFSILRIFDFILYAWTRAHRSHVEFYEINYTRK